MAEELIQTLDAHEGKKEGEAIASYGRSIVFLPKGVQPGESVRVILKEIREDSRGRMMYRGVPANDEYSDNWKDNGDGTGSRVTIATDWKGARSEVGVVETRSFQKREGSPSTQSNLKVIWGNDLASSVIEDSQVRLIPLEEEKVEDGQMVWHKYSERQEPQASVKYPVKGIEIDSWCDWYRNRLVATYDSNLAVKVTVKFTRPDSSWDQSTSMSATWAEMPKWWQVEQEAKFPVCSCGRNRYDVNNPDGYAKCEKCREEEHCIRCGKQAKVKNLSGRLVCAECEPYEAQEQLVDRLVPQEKRQNLAEEAKRVLKGEAVQREAGEIILKSTADHITDSWRKDNITSKWIGYAWYYFCEDGIYGSKLSPTTLQIMAFLPQATGNGLVEMVAWLTGYQKADDCERYGDFYHRTQVKGENQKPSLSESSLNQIQVAARLRGSEVDRLKALEGCKSLVAKLSESDPRAEEVRNILFSSSDQDYALALQKIEEAGKLVKSQEEGEIVLRFGGLNRRAGSTGNQDFWVIRPDGSCREYDSIKYPKSHNRGTPTVTWERVEPEELALRWSKSCSAASHEFEVVKLPVGGCTQAQLSTVAEIQRKLDDEWRGRSGLASGNPSPPVGKGWGLTGEGDVISKPVFNESSSDDTVMAQALRKAGLLK